MIWVAFNRDLEIAEFELIRLKADHSEKCCMVLQVNAKLFGNDSV